MIPPSTSLDNFLHAVHRVDATLRAWERRCDPMRHEESPVYHLLRLTELTNTQTALDTAFLNLGADRPDCLPYARCAMAVARGALNHAVVFVASDCVGFVHVHRFRRWTRRWGGCAASVAMERHRLERRVERLIAAANRPLTPPTR